MMSKILRLACSLLLLSACATTENAASAYFRTSKVKGVEPFETLMARMKKDQKLREIMYGHHKAGYLTQCTLLRNQLYVASFKGSSSQEIIDAVKLMESAYQENDAAFLAACDQIMATKLGKTFVAIQQEYVGKDHQ
jgi:hypothetical protein